MSGTSAREVVYECVVDIDVSALGRVPKFPTVMESAGRIPTCDLEDRVM